MSLNHGVRVVRAISANGVLLLSCCSFSPSSFMLRFVDGTAIVRLPAAISTPNGHARLAVDIPRISRLLIFNVEAKQVEALCDNLKC